ncbi:M20/M25/M40 family metallo-hydrolase [Leuconostoc citreum]|uniref:ArgE/DapE family deacylase n=1 Tax=Leuconostoc citreum TaxID=33964 RepID=UPI000A1E835A|nr:ArgE/DapE family deacylase [Leuconostoc citreum]MCT3067171.1 M20/M25/M40 family metallo-hydrolase [Leuconostoc citreum]OSP82388.1 succinyl-diaminopimelate desuccinylase [Leuconostoc citreum]QEA46332.1 M20/M25/M40 family metallo-hydrolase [Leuconostoc citreum]QEA63022.1 M20/M25/M40 family metallo-hydrolase [Leuconostoc citreum]
MNQAEQMLQDIVGMNTAGNHEADVAAYLEALFNQHNITNKLVKLSDRRIGVIAEIGNGNGPILAFDGHEDTVALGDMNKWQHNPLSGEKIDGKIFGRGITDMKSGLMAAAIAMVNLKKQESKLNGTFKFYATVGEESGEIGAKQMVELGLASHIDALLIGEPSGLPLVGLPKNHSSEALPGIVLQENLDELIVKNNTQEQHFLEIAHKGALSYQVTSEGRAAHSSMPELGINAVEALLVFISQQKKYFESLTSIANDFLGTTTPVITEISGGEQPNTVPGHATMTVFIRTIPEVSQELIIRNIETIINQLNDTLSATLRLDVTIKHAPVSSSPESRLSQIAKNVGEKILEQKLPFIGVSGGTDASQFIKVNPDMAVLVFGPGNVTAHQVNEFVYADMYHKFIKVYEEIVSQYLA